jgi:hypothetical protein
MTGHSPSQYALEVEPSDARLDWARRCQLVSDGEPNSRTNAEPDLTTAVCGCESGTSVLRAEK